MTQKLTACFLAFAFLTLPLRLPAATDNQVVGRPAIFTVTVASGTLPFTYQWLKNGAPIGGATNASFTITSVVLSDAATYTVVVTNVAGSTTSDNGILTVSPAPIPPAGATVGISTP